jgi:DNA-binding transcriptional LysR family regulator
MDLPHLRAFVILAELKHFGRAADRLHITQPALTKRLRALEETIGARLFERDRKGTVLTPIGETLLADATRITTEADALLSRSKNVIQGKEGRLDIGFGLSTIDIAPRMVGEYRRAYPDVAVTLNDFSSAEQLERLEDGRLDLGFVRLPSSSPLLETKPLAVDRLAVAYPSDWSDGPTAPHFNDFTKAGFILLNRSRGPGLRAQIDRWCSEAGVSLHIVQTADDIQTLLALVAANVGVSIVPQQAARLMSHSVKLLMLEGAEADWSVGLAWRPDRHNPPLRNFLRQVNG